MAERITTLLQDRLPLDPDRRLKVPAIRPEDDMVTVRRRLGRYLYDSLAKDTDRETLAVGTANMIWPGCEPVDRETDADANVEYRSGSFVNATTDGGLQWKHSPQDYFKTLVPDPDQLWNFKTIYQAPGKLSDGVAEASNAIRVGISDL